VAGEKDVVDDGKIKNMRGEGYYGVPLDGVRGIVDG
jgi:hypothetical protein